MGSTDQTLVATAISELTRNIVEYARDGELIVREIEEYGRRGLLIIARDGGPGIRDVKLAMQDGYSTGNSLGMGLPGARRIVDYFEIDSGTDRGTTITMKKWSR
jgi:serine/threonine-protein kinase RsbT